MAAYSLSDWEPWDVLEHAYLKTRPWFAPYRDSYVVGVFLDSLKRGADFDALFDPSREQRLFDEHPLVRESLTAQLLSFKRTLFLALNDKTVFRTLTGPGIKKRGGALVITLEIPAKLMEMVLSSARSQTAIDSFFYPTDDWPDPTDTAVWIKEYAYRFFCGSTCPPDNRSLVLSKGEWPPDRTDLHTMYCFPWEDFVEIRSRCAPVCSDIFAISEEAWQAALDSLAPVLPKEKESFDRITG